MEYQVLGEVEVWSSGASQYVGGVRERRALAVLLLHANRPVGVDQLIDVLWGEAPPPTVAAQVRNTIATLRRHLVAAGAAVAPLSRTSGGFVFRVDPGQLDLAVFDEAVREARTLADDGRLDRAADVLRGALELWHGPALGGLGSVLDAERHALNESRLTTVERRVELDLALGRHRDLLPELGRLVGEHLNRERLVELYLLALYRSGRRQDALDEYGRARARLAAELGLDPRPELVALQQAVLRGDPSLDAPAMPTPAEAANRPEAVPAQLPADAPAFTGRSAQLGRLDEMLSRRMDGDGPNLCVISGIAGIGKTTLAVHWAHRARPSFPDGQLYVDMRGFSADPPLTPVDALSRFVRALGMPVDEIPLEQDEIADAYRTMTATRRLLVIVDNARHVDQIRPLLPSGPGCFGVVTGRTQLSGLVAVEGAAPVVLDVLPAPDTMALITRIAGPGRAAPDAAADLAQVCGHLPLAVRIAAAQLLLDPGRPVADLVRALRPGRTLAGLSLPDDPRASVPAAFDYSYLALDPALRRTLRLLGAAPSADFSVAAVAVLAGVAPQIAAAALDELVANHLVDRAGDRYTVHDLIREHAAAQPEEVPGDAAEAVSELLAWLLCSADAAVSLISRPAVHVPVPEPRRRPAASFDEAADALAWLDHERANLVAAIRSATSAGDPEMAWRLATAMRGYFRRGMHTADWLTAAQATIDTARAVPTAERPRVLAMGHLSLGLLHQTTGKPADAVTHFTAAADAARAAGWMELEGSALGSLGVMAWRGGDLPEAARQLRQASVLARSAGNLAVEANNLGNLAIVTDALGQVGEAAVAYEELIPLFRRTGSRDGEAHAASNVADVYRRLGRYDDAVRSGMRAADLFHEIGDAQEAAALTHVAAARTDLGDHVEALRLAKQGLAISMRANHRYLEVASVGVIGYALYGAGDFEASLRHATRSLELAEALDSRDLLGKCHCEVAETLLALGRLEEAESQAASALAMARVGGYHLNVADALVVLAEAAEGHHEARLAAEYAREAYDIGQKAGVSALADRAYRVLERHPDM